MKRNVELKRTPFRSKPSAFGAVRATGKPRAKSLKSKQRTVTDQERAMWTRLATLGCVACMKDGRFNPHVSIHHIDGRTKPDCHKLVLPLCGEHHQHRDDDPLGRVGVHPYKARFEALYGSQEELMAYCAELLEAVK